MAKRKKPRSVRPLTEEKILDRIDDATEGVESAFEREFRASLRSAIRATDLATLEVAVLYGDEKTAERAFDWSKLEGELGDALAGEGKTAAALADSGSIGVEMGQRIAAGVGVELPDGLINDALNKAREQIGQAGLNRARDMTVESRRAIRGLVREAFKPNRSIVDIAAAVAKSVPASQVSKLMGLNERQSEALGKKIYGWLNDPNIKQSDLQRLIDRERERMITQRATSIARTEAVAAANQGMLESWKEGKRDGALKAFLKEWVAREVGACERCRAFDGKRVEIDQEFVSDLGERAMLPEIHPGGFCGMRLVPKS